MLRNRPDLLTWCGSAVIVASRAPTEQIILPSWGAMVTRITSTCLFKQPSHSSALPLPTRDHFLSSRSLAQQEAWPSKKLGPARSLAQQEAWPSKKLGPARSLAQQEAWPSKKLGPDNTGRKTTSTLNQLLTGHSSLLY